MKRNLLFSLAQSRQLEFALYCNASSFEECADYSTLQDRIGALDVAAASTQAASATLLSQYETAAQQQRQLLHQQPKQR
jgi:hypothetical protein